MINKLKSELPQVFPEYSSVPEKITSNLPFIAIGDINVVAGKISLLFLKDKRIKEFQHQLLQLQRQHAPEGSSFYYIPQGDLVSKIEAKVFIPSRNTGIINFDRYIFQGKRSPNLIRLELSRGADNQLIARPGAVLSKEDQVKNLIAWIRSGRYKKIILVDDVVAFATTFPPIVEIIRKELPNVEISVVAGICSSKGTWSGKEKLEDLSLNVNAVIIAEASEAIKGSTSGMAIPDSRDSTIFGGKVGISKDGRPLSFPYFYPFSVPTTSLMKSDVRKQASMSWIRYNIDLVRYIDRKTRKKLLIADLILNGFGIPHTSIEEFKQHIPIPENNTSVLEYLNFIMSVTPKLLKSYKE